MTLTARIRDIRWVLPPLYPEWLGDRGFGAVRFLYATGEMADGIATTRMVNAAAGAGLLGFFDTSARTPNRSNARSTAPGRGWRPRSPACSSRGPCGTSRRRRP